VANNIDQASIRISEVNENVAQISRVSSEIATDISLVDNVAGEMSGRVTHMSKGAKGLDKLSLDLREKISVFKVYMDDNQDKSESSLTEQDIPDIFPWSSKLVTSIDIIDAHHMELVRMVNLLHKTMRMQKGSKEVGRLLCELAEYTVFHFEFEEELFEKYAYPETDQHLKVHKELVSKVIGFQDDFNACKATITMDLMSFLTDWLKNHIMKTDMKYVPHLSGNMAADD